MLFEPNSATIGSLSAAAMTHNRQHLRRSSSPVSRKRPLTHTFGSKVVAVALWAEVFK